MSPWEIISTNFTVRRVLICKHLNDRMTNGGLKGRKQQLNLSSQQFSTKESSILSLKKMTVCIVVFRRLLNFLLETFVGTIYSIFWEWIWIRKRASSPFTLYFHLSCLAQRRNSSNKTYEKNGTFYDYGPCQLKINTKRKYDKYIYFDWFFTNVSQC